MLVSDIRGSASRQISGRWTRKETVLRASVSFRIRFNWVTIRCSTVGQAHFVGRGNIGRILWRWLGAFCVGCVDCSRCGSGLAPWSFSWQGQVHFYSVATQLILHLSINRPPNCLNKCARGSWQQFVPQHHGARSDLVGSKSLD
jgi:hypothetical protein